MPELQCDRLVTAIPTGLQLIERELSRPVDEPADVHAVARSIDLWRRRLMKDVMLIGGSRPRRQRAQIVTADGRIRGTGVDFEVVGVIAEGDELLAVLQRPDGVGNAKRRNPGSGRGALPEQLSSSEISQ